MIKASGALGGIPEAPPTPSKQTGAAQPSGSSVTNGGSISASGVPGSGVGVGVRPALVGGVKSIASIAGNRSVNVDHDDPQDNNNNHQQQREEGSQPQTINDYQLGFLVHNQSSSSAMSPNPKSGPSSLSTKTTGGGSGVGDAGSSVFSPNGRSGTASSTLGRIFNLLPSQSANFSIAFMPRRDFRQSLKTTLVGAGAGDKPTEAQGKMIVTFSTGQCLHVPISAKVATPFITASSPNLWFGVCHVTTSTEGTIVLSNPTDVTAKWTVAHVPASETTKRVSAIQVAGYNERGPETDDPTVFNITPNMGVVRGPSISVHSAVGAPPKDYNRINDTETAVVQQRLSETSWGGTMNGTGTKYGGVGGTGYGTQQDKSPKRDDYQSHPSTMMMTANKGDKTPQKGDKTPLKGKSAGSTMMTTTHPSANKNNNNNNTNMNASLPPGFGSPSPVILTVKDTMQRRFESSAASDTRSDALYPMPIQITFKPRKNIRYNSRFRFTCEYGNAFDLILQGEGTYEENEHKPLMPFPR